MAKADAAVLNVLVATPGGGTGQGGIDRIMASLRDEAERQQRPDLHVRFAATRGNGHLVFSIWHMSVFILKMLVLRLAGRLDVVHLNLAVDGSTWRKLILAWLAHRLGVAYLVHLHGSEYQDFWTTAPNRRNRVVNWLFGHAGRVVVLGTMWRKMVLERLPALASRVVIVPNAAPRPKLEHRGGGNLVHILFLGRLGDRKGVPQLGEALARMKADPGWRATIAGDGHVEEARSRAAEMGLSERVDIPGWIGPDGVAELIANADILVLPSFHENLPISIIEAMAAGLAIVTTPVGAVEDIITDAVNGLLVPPGDVDALTTALSRLVADRDLRIQLGDAARDVHRARLDMEVYLDALVQTWRGTVNAAY
ncbi:MAG TPA: glycosyltransferase family 4 protein [Devosia sp.]|nr:glycosyltransferase family 4 protein [Devosia sp.]